MRSHACVGVIITKPPERKNENSDSSEAWRLRQCRWRYSSRNAASHGPSHAASQHLSSGCASHLTSQIFSFTEAGRITKTERVGELSMWGYCDGLRRIAFFSIHPTILPPWGKLDATNVSPMRDFNAPKNASGPMNRDIDCAPMAANKSR